MPTQHIATLLGATCCVRLATVLRCAATCWVLLAQIWPASNLSQQHATCRNRVAKRAQHVAPNNVGICWVGMLRTFGRGFTFCTCTRSCARADDANSCAIGMRNAILRNYLNAAWVEPLIPSSFPFLLSILQYMPCSQPLVPLNTHAGCMLL